MSTMDPSITSIKSTTPGAAIYTSWILQFFYDIWVLWVSNSFIWRCPTKSSQLSFFQIHTCTSKNHLDIGVGTGYYPAHTKFPDGGRVTLCDLNENSLQEAEGRLKAKGGRLETRCIQHDIEKPLPVGPEASSSTTKYNSISLMYLLHCMPGPTSRKCAIFGHLKHNLAPNGVLFGTTILGDSPGVTKHNWMGNILLWLYNGRGIFDNMDDTATKFLEVLKEHYEDVDAKVEGVVLMFVARKPRI